MVTFSKGLFASKFHNNLFFLPHPSSSEIYPNRLFFRVADRIFWPIFLRSYHCRNQDPQFQPHLYFYCQDRHISKRFLQLRPVNTNPKICKLRHSLRRDCHNRFQLIWPLDRKRQKWWIRNFCRDYDLARRFCDWVLWASWWLEMAKTQSIRNKKKWFVECKRIHLEGKQY